MKKGILLFLILSLSFFTSCSVRTALVRKNQGIADPLFYTIKSYNERVEALEGKALIMYEGSKKTVSFKANILAYGDARYFRLDIFDFVFNKPLATILRNDEEVLAVLHFKKGYYSFNYENLDFKDLTGFDIPKEVFVHSVLGKIYMFNGELKKSHRRAKYLIIEGTNVIEEIFFNRDLLPARTVYTFQSHTYKIKFSMFKNYQGNLFPNKITIRNQKNSLDINYTAVNINSIPEKNQFIFDRSTLKEFTKLN